MKKMKVLTVSIPAILHIHCIQMENHSLIVFKFQSKDMGCKKTIPKISIHKEMCLAIIHTRCGKN